MRRHFSEKQFDDSFYEDVADFATMAAFFQSGVDSSSKKFDDIERGEIKISVEEIEEFPREFISRGSLIITNSVTEEGKSYGFGMTFISTSLSIVWYGTHRSGISLFISRKINILNTPPLSEGDIKQQLKHKFSKGEFSLKNSDWNKFFNKPCEVCNGEKFIINFSTRIVCPKCNNEEKKENTT